MQQPDSSIYRAVDVAFIAPRFTLGLRLTKDALNFTIDAPSLEAAIAIEDRNQVLCTQTPDFDEGVRAFLEKREPVYEGHRQ